MRFSLISINSAIRDQLLLQLLYVNFFRDGILRQSEGCGGSRPRRFPSGFHLFFKEGIPLRAQLNRYEPSGLFGAALMQITRFMIRPFSGECRSRNREKVIENAKGGKPPDTATPYLNFAFLGGLMF